MTEAPAKPPRGWVTLYAVAFVLMLVAGLLIAVAGRRFLESTTPLWCRRCCLGCRDRAGGAGRGAAEAEVTARRRRPAALLVALGLFAAACTPVAAPTSPTQPPTVRRSPRPRRSPTGAGSSAEAMARLCIAPKPSGGKTKPAGATPPTSRRSRTRCRPSAGSGSRIRSP